MADAKKFRVIQVRSAEKESDGSQNNIVLLSLDDGTYDQVPLNTVTDAAVVASGSTLFTYINGLHSGGIDDTLSPT